LIYKISIKGTVQGVGFRPFIYKLAHSHNLNGSICNDSKGVKIYINATKDMLDSFVDDIYTNIPPLATIDRLEVEEIEEDLRFDSFEIVHSSENGDIEVDIPSDLSICPECEKELFDSSNRRYLYPFITCTNCGVRYSIIEDLPYDRAKTSMKFFAMCDKCEAEYSNPLDRRYHAQPIGCWECGVSMSLYHKDKRLDIDAKDMVQRVSNLLLDGHIVAIKGVGGYHLMCDASNDGAVRRLRDRKNRPSKPFALMCKDIDMAKQISNISDREEELLTSLQRPIVLLKSKNNSIYSKEVTPNLSTVGIFLPYTPLHILIMNYVDRPLVATSANISNEPISTNLETISKLSGVYDYLLEHNREILNGCDDSVVMVVDDRELFVRKARGYTPFSVKLDFEFDKPTLALGANQKSTIALGIKDKAIISPYIGDLDTIESVEYFKKTIDNLKRLYHFKPKLIIHDKHPMYESSRVAKEMEERENIPRVSINHHHAHILATMATSSSQDRVLGVAFDGTGYGDDGNLWGGEFMICGYQGYERVAHFRYFKLLGGAKAIKEPRRVALSMLFDIYGDEILNFLESEAFPSDKVMINHQIPTLQAFTPRELKMYWSMWQKGLNSPLSSSVGRIFDAVASLCGVVQSISYEGESGMLLEELYDSSVLGSYEYHIVDGVIDISDMISSIVQEESKKVAISKFFHTLVDIVDEVSSIYGLDTLLSGGVFQNRVLLELILKRNPKAIISSTLSPNDSSISLGQLVSQRCV